MLEQQRIADQRLKQLEVKKHREAIKSKHDEEERAKY